MGSTCEPLGSRPSYPGPEPAIHKEVIQIFMELVSRSRPLLLDRVARHDRLRASQCRGFQPGALAKQPLQRQQNR